MAISVHFNMFYLYYIQMQSLVSDLRDIFFKKNPFCSPDNIDI